MKPFPDLLGTERLVLRPPSGADAEQVLAAVTASYSELHRWMEWARGPYGIEQARRFCTDARHEFDAGRNFTALLALAENETLVGCASLLIRDESLPSFEMGYWVHTQHTGRGYATEAAEALARLAFEDCGAKRVELRINESNRRSRAVAERLGFELEGPLKPDGRDNEEKSSGSLVYAMTDLRALRNPAQPDIRERRARPADQGSIVCAG